MCSVFEKFPWKKDHELLDEACKLFTAHYENWAILKFGCELADVDDIDIVFRKGYPDAILVKMKTNETLNIEFEEYSSNFKEHGHEPEKCDLIVCSDHNWNEKFPNEKCPLPVYVIGGKFFPKEGG